MSVSTHRRPKRLKLRSCSSLATCNLLALGRLPSSVEYRFECECRRWEWDWYTELAAEDDAEDDDDDEAKCTRLSKSDEDDEDAESLDDFVLVEHWREGA